MDRDGSSSDPVSTQETGILESTRGLTAVLDCLPHPAWIFDRSGRYVFQNRIDRETHGSAVGLLPSYATAGTGAPLMLVGLRLLQGLERRGREPFGAGAQAAFADKRGAECGPGDNPGDEVDGTDHRRS